jgi:hypothetical protein
MSVGSGLNLISCGRAPGIRRTGRAHMGTCQTPRSTSAGPRPRTRARPALARLGDSCWVDVPSECPNHVEQCPGPQVVRQPRCGLTSIWVATATAAALAWSVLTPAAVAVLRTRSAPSRAKQVLRSSSKRPASWRRHAAYSVSLSSASPLAAARARANGNNRVEADHGRLKARLRPMRAFKQDCSAPGGGRRACVGAERSARTLRVGCRDASEPGGGGRVR